MQTLYLDCSMGAAGDMLGAALLELFPARETVVAELNALGIPGVAYCAEPSVKCGITGTHLRVTVHGAEEEAGHDPAQHAHHHSGMEEIGHIVAALALPAQVKQDVLAVYTLLAQAESRVHGVQVDQIHFHEVGTLDAVADIAAVCLLMRRLAPARVVVSPVHVGSGQVRCAHGLLPVPAPATAALLQGVPIYGGRIQGELCTPTGAALLRYFANDFGAMPPMRVSAIGYGMGRKDFEAANCVRAMLGAMEERTGQICELACNVDDMTGEAVGFAMEQLLQAGALDAYTAAIGMKKSRPGILLRVLCRPEDRQKMAELLFQHTTTLGVRVFSGERYVLDRQITRTDTPYGTVRRKDAAGYGVTRRKYEYDDLARIAREQNISLAEAAALLEK